MIRRYRIKDYNFRLVIALILLSAIGVLLVGSADPSLKSKQFFGVLSGLVLMVLVSLFDYSWILKMYWLIYVVCLGLLILVRIFGDSIKGASRWIVIGGFQFQPTEICKVLLILFFAMFFMKHENDVNKFKTIIKAVLLLALPAFLIFDQPDLKNTITVTVLFCLLYFAAGLSYKNIGKILLIVVPMAVVALFLIVKTDLPIIDDYQKGRILAKLYSEDEEFSDDTLQQDNSVMAIGSGGLTGKGLDNNRVTTANKSNFVPENQNDFIFAVAGEELGFAGCAAILLLLLAIVYEALRLGRKAKDKGGTLICAGMAANIGIQAFINMAVATGIFPNTGTPLPFVSYGVTSLWSLFIGMGLVLNVGLQRQKHFDDVVLGWRESLR